MEYTVTGSPDFVFGTVGTYTCNNGYGIDGQRSRTCQGDGSGVSGYWTGTMESCEGELAV